MRSVALRTRRGSARVLLAALAAGAVIPASVMGIAPAVAETAEPTEATASAQPGQETDEYGFPTWAEVERARGNESDKQAQIEHIRGLISTMESDVQSKQAYAAEQSRLAQIATQQLDQAVGNQAVLEEQEREARERAEESRKAVAAMVGELARAGGSGNLTLELFGNPGSADDTLYQLGLMDSVSARNATLYTQAQEDANTAQSLADQAQVAREERERLQQAAMTQQQEAFAAQAEAQQALDTQINHRGELEAQLTVLVENRAATEADFQKGQEYREELRRQEEERRRREAEEAARRAEEQRKAWEAEQARIAEEQRRAAAEEERRLAEQRRQEQAAQAAAPTPAPAPAVVEAPPQVNTPAPTVSGNWTRPSYGVLTSHFGMRWDPLGSWGYVLHPGTDYSAGCGAPVFAASGGTVVDKGWDLYGANYVSIDHGDGIETRYYHMMQPAHVYVGQWVSAGEVIAYEGTTGWSTGCHLHFEVRQWGAPIDPYQFLGANGVW